jgi:DNA-binding CsgD family transcriptional regulator
VTEPHAWPLEQSARGTLRPWAATAAGYLAVVFADPDEAERARRGLQQRGVPEGDLRLYDAQETLAIAARLQHERSVLAKAINQVVPIARCGTAGWTTPGPVGPCCGSMPPPRIVPTGWWAAGRLPLRDAALLRRQGRGRRRRGYRLTFSPDPGQPAALHEELSEGELRVLRYLPSNLSAPEIGRELYLSFHTVKTHMRSIYAKLGVHRRTEAVERARELGLLAPSSRRR